MKRYKSVEKRIRLIAILIYAIVALLCIGMLIYLYNQKESIGSQKQNIEQNKQTLALTNKLISFVNHAQANANLYIVSKKKEYILRFAEDMEGVQCYIDSLKPHSPQAILVDIEFLLNKKATNISDLNIQFDNYNLADSVSRKLRKHEMSLLDSVVSLSYRDRVTTTTISGDIPKRGFFKRLAEAFAPDKATKVKLEKKIIEVDTLMTGVDSMSQPDMGAVFADLLNIIQKTNKKYTLKIANIEKQVAALMMSDHEISMQLSNLLIELHQQTIESTVEELRKSERFILSNYTRSIIGTFISLLLILTFVILIIKNANKGYKTRKALEHANIRIKETIESRHELLLSISHDVKTPISSILGYLELWKNGHVISSKEVVAMQHSGKHILDLVENLLDYSQLDQGLLQVTPVNFNLHELSSEMVELMTPLILHKKLSFDVHFNFDKTLQLQSDVLKIKQIVINILSNAAKYTEQGSVQFNITYNDGNIEFEVNDTGKGIRAEQINTIFQAFSRVEENSASVSGNGFGLFVAKGMADLLNGTIEFRSFIGSGTKVKIIIPAKEISDWKIETKSIRILAIDDDLVFLSVLEKMLLELGHKVDTCHTLETCEKLSKQIENYDVVLTDAEMITFSGIDILAKMKSKGITLPVILMSGRNDLNYTKSIHLGFKGFLQKPVTLASLQQQFGGKKTVCGSLSSLEELFGEDKNAIDKILRAFLEDTTKNILLLEQAVAENDFAKVRKTCHKMLPMFMQMGAVDDAVVILTKMNEWHENQTDNNFLWKDEILNLINLSKELVTEMEKKL